MRDLDNRVGHEPAISAVGSRAVKALSRQLHARLSGLYIFSGTKSFAHPWVGHPTLNRLGLHPARIALANAVTEARRRSSGTYGDSITRALCRDGVAVVPNFLGNARFAALVREVRRRVEDAERLRGVESPKDHGFGPKRPFAGGFDRWDGGTLNRYLFIDESMPETRDTAVTLARLGGLSLGVQHSVDKVWIYQTVHGDEADNHDIQKDLHRDTFHRATKLWFYLEDVEPEQGPFVYVPRSHLMTSARYRWEYARALGCCREGRANGSFRVDEAELEALDLVRPRPLPVKANTLVIADVAGFHRRGDAKPGARRLSLYSGIRRNPFLPF